MGTGFFYLCSITACVAALKAVTSRNLIRGGLWFTVVQSAVAGLCALSGAGFAAAAVLLVFGLGTGILFIVAAVFLDLREQAPLMNTQRIPAAIAVSFLCGALLLVVRVWDTAPAEIASVVRHQDLSVLAEQVFGEMGLFVVVVALIHSAVVVGVVLCIKER